MTKSKYKLFFLLSLTLNIQTGLAETIPFNTNNYKLVSNQNEYHLINVTDEKHGIINIPKKWIVTKEQEKEDKCSYVSSSNFDEAVTSFNIGKNLTGIHLSSYEINKEGSAQAASGRDVFIVIDLSMNKIFKGLTDLGITKSRTRFMGCFSASFTNFILSDINGDSYNDIGVIKEELSCKEAVKDDIDVIDGPFYKKHSIRWYIFKNNSWKYDKKFDEVSTKNEYYEFPMIGLAKSPVDYVKNLGIEIK